MRRRDFITLLGSTAAAWPLTARAQQAGKLPTIGCVGSTPSGLSPFVARLRELSWIEGRTVAIEYRGERDATSAMPRLPPSSSGSRST